MGRSARFRLLEWRPLLRVFGLVVVGSAVLLGCGRGTFLGRQYDDLTAYYNTFYNANRAFEEGVESMGESGAEIDRTRYISVFPHPETGTEEESFKEAIQKSADVLRNHPESKWVDDALLLIGRSRYYQGDYVGAVQKFREVIALGAEREGEAQFRLAQTLVAADRFSEAAEALRAGLDREADYGTWTARMQVVQGELFVRQEQWTDAEEALEQGLDGSLPDQLGARAAFLLGQVRETIEDPEGAQTAYRRVLEYDPPYQLAFSARLGALGMEGRHGDPERALERLSSLEREDNTSDMRGEIARVRARLYEEQGQSEEAKRVLATVLREDDAPTGTVQGRVHYDLATLYRDAYEDFTQAAAHFDTATTNLSSGRSQEAQVLPRGPSDAAAQAERFQDLADRSRAVTRMDSLLHLGRMPPAEFQSVVEQLRKQRLKEQAQDQQSQRRREQQFQGGTQGRARGQPSSTSQEGAVQTRDSDAGFLFHRDPTLVQQGRRQFEQAWGDRPLVDNWRRVEALRGRSSPPTADEEEAAVPGTEPSTMQGEAASVVDLSAVPRDSASQAEMEAQRAVARYELANSLFRAAGRPDSAETWFRRILEEDEGHEVARQALYGLAQTLRAQGDTSGAEDAYDRIIERYPGTPYAKRARQQLGQEQVAESRLEVSEADSAYAQAFETWQRGRPDSALGAFLAVAQTYPETSAAPRALLAAGVVYHRFAERDSSGRFRGRFERFTDSLAQSDAGVPVGSDSIGADTTAGERQSPTQDSLSSDTARAETFPQERADTTAERASPRRVVQPSGPESDTSEASGDAPERTPTDSTSRDAETLESLSRRETDSSAVAEQERISRRPDSIEADSAGAPSDTTAQTILDTDSTRAQATDEAPPDSAQTGSEGRGGAAPLTTLLTHLTEKYSGTPEAERARTLLSHLEQRRPSADSVSSDSASVGASPRRDSSASGPEASAADSAATSKTKLQEQPAVPDSAAREEGRPGDSTRTEEGAPGVLRRRDSTTTPVRDSSAAPEREGESSSSSDLSRKG